MNKQIIGWDIGGAHVKAAILAGNGEVLKVLQAPCPLWKGIAQLALALQPILSGLDLVQYRHALTMTGELVDCFTSREQGVQAILQAMQASLGEAELWIYAGRCGFLNMENISCDHYQAIASVNWLASAELAAKHCRTALFVDIGSTTADILLIAEHKPQVQGYTDYERLVSGELLYTGVVRTSVMAIAQQAEFNGRRMGLMAEHFAAMADVYRLTGDLHPAHDQAETADGAGKTPAASARRLSRLTGYEFAETDWRLWLQFAGYLKQCQKQMVIQACFRQIERGADQKALTLVGAGVGRFLLQEIALEQGWTYRDFTEFFVNSYSGADIDAADCAPAVAVAYLVMEREDILLK